MKKKTLWGICDKLPGFLVKVQMMWNGETRDVKPWAEYLNCTCGWLYWMCMCLMARCLIITTTV